MPEQISGDDDDRRMPPAAHNTPSLYLGDGRYTLPQCWRILSVYGISAGAALLRWHTLTSVISDICQTTRRTAVAAAATTRRSRLQSRAPAD